MNSAEDIFEAESRKFENRLTEKERASYKTTTLEDVKATILQIQTSQNSTKTLMDTSRVKNFLEAMEQFGQVIDIFANSNVYVSFVWGPVKLLLLAARNWADLYDALLDAYRDIGESLPLLKGFGEVFSSDPQLQCYLAWIYADILKFHQEAQVIFRRSSKRHPFKFRSYFQGCKRCSKHFGKISTCASRVSCRTYSGTNVKSRFKRSSAAPSIP